MKWQVDCDKLTIWWDDHETSWPCDKLTGSLSAYHLPFAQILICLTYTNSSHRPKLHQIKFPICWRLYWLTTVHWQLTRFKKPFLLPCPLNRVPQRWNYSSSGQGYFCLQQTQKVLVGWPWSSCRQQSSGTPCSRAHHSAAPWWDMDTVSLACQEAW